MSYSIDDIKIGDMLWVELKGPDQNFGYGEVFEVWKDEETGMSILSFIASLTVVKEVEE